MTRPLVKVMRRWHPDKDPRVAGRNVTMVDAAAWWWICHTGGCAKKPEVGYGWTDTAARRDAYAHLQTHTALDRARALLARAQQRLDDANARAAHHSTLRRIAEAQRDEWRAVADARTCHHPHPSPTEL